MAALLAVAAAATAANAVPTAGDSLPSPPPSQCRLLPGTDFYVAGDQPDLRTPDAAACCAACSAEAGCVAFVWDGVAEGRCYFKGSQAGRMANNHTTAGVIPGKAGPPPFAHACIGNASAGMPFCNMTLGVEARLDDLIGRLTLDEKLGLLGAQPGR